MKPNFIRRVVLVFIFVYFLASLFVWYLDRSSANYVMAHYYQEHYGTPRDWMCIAVDVTWFPLGPFSGVLWAVPMYCFLKYAEGVLDRQRQRGKGLKIP